MNIDKRKLEFASKETFEKMAENKDTDNNLLYGVSFVKQLPITAAIKEKHPNLSRPSIQKSICILSKAPIFGRLIEHFNPIIKESFKKNIFEDTKVTILNKKIKMVL